MSGSELKNTAVQVSAHLTQEALVHDLLHGLLARAVPHPAFVDVVLARQLGDLRAKGHVAVVAARVAYRLLRTHPIHLLAFILIQ